MTEEEKIYLSVLSQRDAQQIVLDYMDVITGNKEQSRQLPSLLICQFTEGLFYARLLANKIATSEEFRMEDWGLDANNPLAHISIGEELAAAEQLSLPPDNSKPRSFKERLRRTGRIYVRLPEVFFSVAILIFGYAAKLVGMLLFGWKGSWLSLVGDGLLLIVLCYLAILLVRQVKRRVV